MTVSDSPWYEFRRRRDGMRHALSGGLWFHRHVWKGEPMAHLVSSDRERLLRAGRRLGMKPEWLQYKPLKDPDTGERVEAWHWDLVKGFFRHGGRLARPWPGDEGGAARRSA